LKVCIQELGNEGSERLNVDIGNAVAQLPTALTGEGNLKVSIQEDFTHNLSTSANQDTQITHLSEIEGAVETIEGCVSSDKVNVNISSGGFDGAITNAHLNELGTAINSAKLDVNISSGNISGFATSDKQDTIEGHLETISEFNCDTTDVSITSGIVLPSALTGSGNLKVCIQELGNEGSERLNVDVGNDITQLPTQLSGSGRLKIENDFDGAITHNALTELASALNSDKLDVNISSGNITGFSTSANQSTTNGHLNAMVNVLIPAIATATSTTIPNKLDIIETTANAIETEVKLGQTCEDKEVIDDDAIASSVLSIAIDTESYKNIRFYGNTTASPASLGGSDLLAFGSNSSSGTYYLLHDGTFQVSTATISGGSATHYISLTLENPPRYIKIYNKHGSASYTITKLRMVGSNKMVNV
jgi:hypothetical protein